MLSTIGIIGFCCICIPLTILVCGKEQERKKIEAERIKKNNEM